jgi:hypothetical protein
MTKRKRTDNTNTMTKRKRADNTNTMTKRKRADNTNTMTKRTRAANTNTMTKRKKGKKTNNDLQNTTQKTKDTSTRIHIIPAFTPVFSVVLRLPPPLKLVAMI